MEDLAAVLYPCPSMEKYWIGKSLSSLPFGPPLGK